MVLLRRVIGGALRARRQAQHRTLREVSTAANVSLGYLSEIERGQKEASSELLAAVCDALGAHLSEVLREVTHTVADAEQGAPAASRPVATSRSVATSRPAGRSESGSRPAGRSEPTYAEAHRPSVTMRVEGDVAVTVRQDTPLRATLHATRPRRGKDRGRDEVLSAA